MEENINQTNPPIAQEPATTPTPPSESKPKFSFRKWPILVIVVLFLIILGMGGYIFYSQKHIKSPQNQALFMKITPTPTQIPTPTPKGNVFEGKDNYVSGRPFTLNFPATCKPGKQPSTGVLPNFPNIICDNGVTIIPNGGHYGMFEGPAPSGFVFPTITTNEVTLDSNTWKRIVYTDNQTTKTYDLSFYSLVENDNFNIEVHYSNYSKNAQDFVESIISTFKYTQ